MNTALAYDHEHFAAVLQQAVTLAQDYLRALEQRPPASAYTPQPTPALPAQGLGAAQALTTFQARFGDHMPASNGPRFWGFVTGGSTPAAVAADWLVSAYDLNLADAAYSPAPDIEFEALAWLRELFGLPESFAGIFVTGATVANMVGLACGREWVGQQHGVSIANAGISAAPPITVLSGHAHSSVFKSLAMIGLGRAALRPVTTLPDNREAVDVAALRMALEQLDGAPCIVVANAGTVNSGDFDDLAAIAALRNEFLFWLHVDAAFGGCAACSPRYRERLAGLERADSITIDAHKWLNVPYDAAMLFTRHRDMQLATFQNSAAYLGAIGDPPSFVHLGPENSRRMRALPVWMSLLAYGRAGYQQIIETTCDLAQQFGAQIEAMPALQLLAPVRLNIVCFSLARPTTTQEIADLLARLQADGRVFMTPTVYQGTPGIRAAFSNWRTTSADVDIACTALQELLAELASD